MTFCIMSNPLDFTLAQGRTGTKISTGQRPIQGRHINQGRQTRCIRIDCFLLLSECGPMCLALAVYAQVFCNGMTNLNRKLNRWTNCMYQPGESLRGKIA